MDAWLARMRRTAASSPASSMSTARSAGRDRRWWGNAYGWGFSPVNPVTGRREDRNRIPRALVGFSNALLVTGDQKYVDAWREMIEAVNAQRAQRSTGARSTRRCSAPMAGMAGSASRGASARSRCGTGRCARPIALRVRRQSVARVSRRQEPVAIPKSAVQRDLESIPRKLAAIRADQTPPDKRLADNMLDPNPAATDSLVRLMWGALVPGREGGLLNARVRYFDPERRRAGVPDDVAALVSGARRSPHGRHARQPQRARAAHGDRPGRRLRRAPVRLGRVERTRRTCRTPATSPCSLAPGAGATLTLAMRRYVNQPTVVFPWDRQKH